MCERRSVGKFACADGRANPALPHALLLPTVWKLRENVTAYDAVYVALADVLGATLVTRDRRLAKAVSHLIDVALV